MLTKTEIRSSWTLLKITHLAHRMSCLTTPIHMKSLPKVKLCQVEVSLNIAQNHFSRPYEVI